MAVFQVESGACTGRGFSDIDADGYLAKFKTWIVKSPVAGGPGWTILLDRSANPIPVDITSVDTGTDIFTKVGHGFYTGETVIYSTDGSNIGGLSNGSSYYIRKINDDTFTLHTTFSRATSDGTVINITSTGSGNHTLTLYGPHIVIAPSAPPSVNSVSKIIVVGYDTVNAGRIYFREFLSWDDTNKIKRGLWSGHRVNTVDSGDFAYNFRGGDECMAVFSRISTSWTYAIVDEWEGIANFVEGANVVGTLQSLVSAGTDVVVQLDTGEASLFIVDHWYYMYDFNDRNLVNYVKVTARDTGLDTITLQQVWHEFTVGGVIGAYPHRFYTYGNTNDVAQKTSQIPYVSEKGNTEVWMDGQGGVSYIEISHQLLSGIDKPQPDDNGLYACMKSVLTEERNQSNIYPYYNSGMNRRYGRTKNMYRVYGTMAQMLDYRIINSTNYLKIAGSSPNVLFLHSESLT
jgi:hypothetical protein